jgi:hypothetical protein
MTEIGGTDNGSEEEPESAEAADTGNDMDM